MDTWQWINDNKAWLFSGLGIMLFFLLRWFFSKGLSTLNYLIIKKLARVKINLFPRYKEGYASLIVENDESQEISNCAFILRDIWRIEGNKQIISTRILNPDNAGISRAGGNVQGSIIGGKREATFNIARIGDGDDCFLLFDNGTEKKLEQGIYYFIVELAAKKGEVVLDNRRMAFYLEYVIEFSGKPIATDNSKTETYRSVIIDIRSNKKRSEKIIPYSHYKFLNADTTERLIQMIQRQKETQ